MDGIGRANKVIQSVHGIFGLDRDRASILLGEFGVGYSFLRGCKHLDTVNRAVRRSFRNESNLVPLRQHKSMIKNGADQIGWKRQYQVYSSIGITPDTKFRFTSFALSSYMSYAEEMPASTPRVPVKVNMIKTEELR
jgi:hypothetical protein